MELSCVYNFGSSLLVSDLVSTVCTLGPYGSTVGSVTSVESWVVSTFLSGGFLSRASSGTLALRTFVCPGHRQLSVSSPCSWPPSSNDSM